MTLSLRHKMKSERGASMSMALMTFLVCTMVASVTLTAATVAAGRQKTLQDADRNYYSVSSAAKVFRDVLGDSDTNVPVVIKRSCVLSPTIDADGNESYTYVDDSVTLAIDACGKAYKSDNDGTKTFVLSNDIDIANIFQILAADMILGENPPVSSTTATMDYECVVTCDKAFETIDTTTTPKPKIKPLNCKSATYVPLNIVVDYAKIDDAQLTVYREENTPQPSQPLNPCVDYRFVFEPKDDSGVDVNYKVTLFVKATAFDSDARGTWDESSRTYTYTWDTTVTWECMSMIVGGA